MIDKFMYSKYKYSNIRHIRYNLMDLFLKVVAIQNYIKL